jgi:DNA polymerase
VSKPLKRHLEMEALFGADFLPISRRKRDLAPKPPEAKPASTSAKPRPPGPEITPWSWPAEYLALRSEALDCTKCGLCRTRTQVVFGVGRLDAPLLFVGEAPGEDEDLQGEPFVGRAGQLLTKTLAKLGVERSRVHIANILKCRPPGNRTPAPEEMLACLPWLEKQIAAIRPKLLCGLGNIAVQTLLDTKTGITRLRGKIVEARGVRILPAFHPAYVLRNMGELPVFEGDLKLACREAGLIS